MEMEVLEDCRRILEQIAGIVSGCDYDPRRDMYFIDPASIPEDLWVLHSRNWWVPEVVDTMCPYCCKLLTVSAKPVSEYISEIKSLAMLGTCPRRCNVNPIRFFLTGLSPSRSTNKRCKAIWMDPEPELRSSIIFGSDLPRGLTAQKLRPYESAIRNYNYGDWSGSVGASAKVIEMIGKSSFPRSDGKATISELFQALSISLKSNSEYATILRPIVGLNDALCIARNPGAHFDTEKDPSQELAAKLLDLVEFLLRYVYLLPSEAQELKSIVSKLGPGDEENPISGEQNNQDSQSENPD